MQSASFARVSVLGFTPHTCRARWRCEDRSRCRSVDPDERKSVCGTLRARRLVDERFRTRVPEHYLFPRDRLNRAVRQRITPKSRAPSEALRAREGVRCRIHDLRHTVATKM